MGQSGEVEGVEEAEGWGWSKGVKGWSGGGVGLEVGRLEGRGVRNIGSWGGV